MRPDGSIVIGHGVVAPLAGANGANAPAGEKLGGHELVANSGGVLRSADFAEKSLACIGRADFALLFFAVERERVHADFFAPESLFEALLESVGFQVELQGVIIFAELAG